MELRKITNRIYESQDKDKIESADNLYYEIAEYLQKIDGNKYKEFVRKAEDICYEFTLEETKGIVREMEPYGEKWTYDEIKTYLEDKSIQEHCKEYYLCINMCFNDYRKTAEKHNVDDVDFYFDLAYDFMYDEDGVEHKIEKYFMLV